MRLSTKGRYAVMAMVDLARQGNGNPVSLEPMTSVERKIVHLHLKDVEGVETRSEGDEPNRHIVVSPAS